jgi:hypothetical protein
VPQTAIDIELCLRLTNGKPALARWIGEGATKVGYMQSARLRKKRFGGQARSIARRQSNRRSIRCWRLATADYLNVMRKQSFILLGRFAAHQIK